MRLLPVCISSLKLLLFSFSFSLPLPTSVGDKGGSVNKERKKKGRYSTHRAHPSPGPFEAYRHTYHD